MGFLPYSRQSITQEDIDAVVDVLKSDWLTQGPAITAFENSLAAYVGAKHALAVSSGTAALHIAYLALGVGPGDEIITSPNTFVATSNAALYCGATPIFVDINPNTGLIDVTKIEAAITPRTKVIAPVDFSGCPSDMAAISEIAKRHNLYVVEDASHSLGAHYRNTKVGDGSYADMTIFSFHPVKPLTTGEGGAITTQNTDLYNTLLTLRTHGITKTDMSQNPGPWYYEMVNLGYNYRITDIQAALGSSQLKRFTSFCDARRRIAKKYDHAFKQCEWVKPLEIPNDCISSYHLYVLRFDLAKINKTRAQVMEILKNNNIGSQVHYIPVYQQPYYQKNLAPFPQFPNMDTYYESVLSIPLYPDLTDSDVEHVITTILSLHA